MAHNVMLPYICLRNSDDMAHCLSACDVAAKNSLDTSAVVPP